MSVPGWPVAFRGSLAAGLVTPGQLRGPRFLRLFPDTHVRAGDRPPDLALRSHAAYRYVRGDGAARAAALPPGSCTATGSPMETRLRLDLAYPSHRIGIEYDGEEHTTPARVRRDIGRATDLVDRGWRIYRYTADDVLGTPDRIVTQIRRALQIDVSVGRGSATTLTSISSGARARRIRLPP